MKSEPRNKLRVVLDTNVLVSAVGFGKQTKKIWDLAEDKKFDLFVSGFILMELERILIEKLDFTAQKAREIAQGVESLATVELPEHRISVIKEDASDNAILECAVSAKAQVIVTGNMKHIRPLAIFQGIQILTPREFLNKHFPEL